jgi:polar amino acid transport system substrate-binding protein
LLTRRTSWLAALLSLLCVAVIAGCGSSSKSSTAATKASTTPVSPSTSSSSSTTSSTTSSSGGAADPAVVAQVPAAIKSKGTLSVAADASYAPNEFIGSDGHTVVGMDADLMKAIGAVMGLKVTVTNVPFASILAGLQAGKYDVGASSFTDEKSREKIADFVDYYSAGESFYTKTQGGVTISGLAGLCGHSVAVEAGTTELDDANKAKATCKKAGKPAVTVLVFQDQNGANLAVSSGRAQLGFADSPVAAYQVKKTGGQFKLVGPSFANAPYGLAMPKGNGLDKSVLAALAVLMKNGTYTSILKKWGIQSGAITTPAINGATS